MQAEATMVGGKALLAQAEAQLARDAANAEYMRLSAESQQPFTTRGIISKDVAEQVRWSSTPAWRRCRAG